MTILQLLGCVLIALPFIALVAFIVRISGWRVALAICASVFAVAGSIILGVWLFKGSL